MTIVYLLAACFVMTCIVFTTANALAGTVVVLATICILVRLAIRGNKENERGLFFGGVFGLAWLAFALGLAIDVPSPKPPTWGEEPHMLVKAQMWLVGNCMPVIWKVKRGPYFEFRSLMDGSFKKITMQTIPSPASWSRLCVSLIALILSWAVARFVAGGPRESMRSTNGDTP